MKKRFMMTVVAVAVMVAAFATTAQATTGKTSACTGCHAKGTTVVISAVQTANNGVNATYKVTVTGPYALVGWAVLSGSTNVANATAGTGTFQVAVGKTYTVWGVSKGSSMPYSNSITISPVAPVVAPPVVVPPVVPPVVVPPVVVPPVVPPVVVPPVVAPPVVVPPVVVPPTVTPDPTVTSDGTSTVTMRMRFGHRRGVIVKLTNVETGEVVIGTVKRNHNRVTFKNVTDGVYVLTVKNRHHKTKTIGTYAVSENKISKWVAPVVSHDDDDEDDD